MRNLIWIVLYLISHFFGVSADHCDDYKCQNQCCPSTLAAAGDDITDLIPKSIFEEILFHRNDNLCPAKGFYTYEAFIAATKSKAFPGFASVGNTTIRKREIAAFLAQTSHETTGGSRYAPDGPSAWGYCLLQEAANPTNNCVPSNQWPCAPGKSYHGRGPFQITYNYNYGPAGAAIKVDLLNNPELVATDPIVSFKTALWLWMTPTMLKPSCHDVITGIWIPNGRDYLVKGRLPGFGMTTNLINGMLECGHGWDLRVQDRIGFYKKYCDVFGVSYGDNIDCAYQRPYVGLMSRFYRLMDLGRKQSE